MYGNEKIKLDIFGTEIGVVPNNFIITVQKSTDEVVNLVRTDQSGEMNYVPIFTKLDFGKTADEFIKEFNEQNASAIHAFNAKNSRKETN